MNSTLRKDTVHESEDPEFPVEKVLRKDITREETGEKGRKEVGERDGRGVDVGGLVTPF